MASIRSDEYWGGFLRLCHRKPCLWLDNVKTITVVIKQPWALICSSFVSENQFFPILKCKSNLSLHSTTMHTHNNIPKNPLIWLLKALQYLLFVYGTKFKILRTPHDLIYPSSSSQPKCPGSLCSRYTHLFWVLQWNICPLISGEMSQESSHFLFLTVALANLCIKSPLQCHSQNTLKFW